MIIAQIKVCSLTKQDKITAILTEGTLSYGFVKMAYNLIIA